MKHRVKNKALGRDTKHRKALFKNLLSSLFEHGAIETTEAKAKVIRRLADKIITKAKPRTLQARRTLERFFGSRQTVNTIVDKTIPLLGERKSGFTTLTKLGRRRGDDAAMVKLELLKSADEEAEEVEKASKSGEQKLAKSKPTSKSESKKAKADRSAAKGPKAPVIMPVKEEKANVQVGKNIASLKRQTPEKRTAK